MSRPGVLAIDLGTSSARAGVVYADGEVAPAAAQRRYRLSTDVRGLAEIDAELVLGLLVECVDEALRELPGDCELRGVAMSTFWHGVCGVDATGRPTTRVLTWADRRAADCAAQLRAELDERSVHARTGCVLHPSYVPAKLRWFARERPDVWRRTARWLSPGELALQRFCGAARVSASMASATGLYDLHAGTWDPEVLAAVQLDPSRLSALSDAPLDGLRGEWARRWPALARLPWFPAYGDGGCSNVGCGAVGTDRAALNIGTSGALRVTWRGEDVQVPEGLWAYRAAPHLLCLGGALSAGGNVVAWLRELLRLPGPEEAERAIAAMAPAAHGLAFLPLMAGERGPGWADHASGAIAGLSMATGPLDVLRAGLEAVALRFALVDEILEAALPGDHQVIGTGGGVVHSPAWAQILADALGRPLTPSRVAEASARGAGLLCLEALGEIDAVESIPAPLGETIQPDPERHAIYARELARQRELYALLIERSGA